MDARKNCQKTDKLRDVPWKMSEKEQNRYDTKLHSLPWRDQQSIKNWKPACLKPGDKGDLYHKGYIRFMT